MTGLLMTGLFDFLSYAIGSGVYGLHCCVSLQDLVPELVNQSRSALISDEPDLVKPGGKLHPQERADACWRDGFHFLRVSLAMFALATNHRSG